MAAEGEVKGLSGDSEAPGEAEDIDGKLVEIEKIPDDEGQEEAPHQPQAWGSRLGYLLTLVGYAVGFGNVWRFPYMLRENGGLVFLIPYCVMLALVGIPIFFMELAVGQRRRKGIVYCWNEISPSYGGLGLTCAMICYMVGLYYTSFLAYSVSYFIDSFKSPLPWTTCNSISEDVVRRQECLTLMDGRSTKYYWFRGTLDVSPGIDDPGTYSWYLAMCHVLAWAVNWAILSRDSTVSSAKVAYVTAIFPYVVLVIFFIANFVSDGAKAARGTWRLLKPEWRFLLYPTTWLKAGSQIFFSLGLGSCLVVFAAHNPARYDCHKDAIIISIVNGLTSLFAAFVVFPMMGKFGHMKYEQCVAQMEKLLPGLNLWTKHKADFFDIYMLTNLTNPNDLSQNIPLLVAYGDEEWGEDEDELYYSGGRGVLNVMQQRTDHFKFETVVSAAGVVAGGSLSQLRNCSIAVEASESGGGTGFVFVGFTQAVLTMYGSNFWSAIFFVMLFTLGIDSGFGTIEGAVVALEELYTLKRWVAAAIVCGSLTVLSLCLFPFGWGIYILDLIDQWTCNWTVLLIAIAECLAVSWSYGLATMAYDVRLMTGKKPNMFILLCWKYLGPLILIILLVASIVEFIMDSVEKGIIYTTFDLGQPDASSGDFDKPYPWYSISVGFMLMIVCLIWIPLQAALKNSKFSLIKPKADSDFPEEELREERQIAVDREEQQFTKSEKTVMGKASLLNLQNYRDRKASQASIPSRTSSKSLTNLNSPKNAITKPKK